MGKVIHVVLYMVNPALKGEELDEMCQEMIQLKETVTVQGKGIIVETHGGLGVSPENEMNGYTHCFTSVFPSVKERDEYIHHPVKVAYVTKWEKHWDGILVFDYVPGEYESK